MTDNFLSKWGSYRTASAWRRDTELEVFLSSKGWIQTIANQRREEITKTEGKQSNDGTALRRVLVPTQRNMHNNVF